MVAAAYVESATTYRIAHRIDAARPLPADHVMAARANPLQHVSPAIAEAQVASVAAARGLDVATVRDLVAFHTNSPLLGDPLVDLLTLNQALDDLK